MGPRKQGLGPNSGWSPGSGAQEPKAGAWDLGPWKRIFRKFSVFPDAWHLWIHVLYVYVYFVCFSLPSHKAYTLLIFDHLNPFRALCVCVCVLEGGGGLCPKSRAWSMCASPSWVYPAGKLQWHFTCGFDFRHSLWLPFCNPDGVINGSCGSHGSLLAWG